MSIIEFQAIFRAKTEATDGGRGVYKSQKRANIVYGYSLKLKHKVDNHFLFFKKSSDTSYIFLCFVNIFAILMQN